MDIKSFMAHMFGGEKKSSENSVLDELRSCVLGLPFNGAETESGSVVNPKTAMSVSAIYACVGLIAETIGQLPIRVKKTRKEGGSESAENLPIYRLLSQRPNEWQTSQEFREMLTQHLCLTGNCYALIIRDMKGEPRELLPLTPEQVTVEQDQHWNVIYKVWLNNHEQRIYTQRDIFHLKYRTLDGYRGISPIGWQRETVGNAIATSSYSSRLYRNGGRPSGVVSLDGTLSEPALKRFRESWEANYSGSNAYKTAILESGAKYSPISMSMEDMQFIQTRSFSVEEVARIYRVPLHMIQSTEKTTSWGSGIEQMSIGFVQMSLLPWIKRWENCIQKYLINDNKVYVKLAVEGLMRGDMTSRYTAYQTAVNSGFMSPNEVRALEDLNPREGGDDYYMPLNMSNGKEISQSEKGGSLGSNE